MAGIANFFRSLFFCRCDPEANQQEKVPVRVPVDRPQSSRKGLGTSSRIKVFVNDPSDVSQWSDGSQWSPSNVPVSAASSRTASNGSVGAMNGTPIRAVPRRVPSTPDIRTSHLPSEYWMMTQSSNQPNYLSPLTSDSRTPIVRQVSSAQHAPPVVDLVQADKVAAIFSSNIADGNDVRKDGPSCPAGQEIFTKTALSNTVASEKDEDKQAPPLQGTDSRRHSKTSQGSVTGSQGLPVTIHSDKALRSLMGDQDHAVAMSPKCEPLLMVQTPRTSREKSLEDVDAINDAQRSPISQERLPRRQRVVPIPEVRTVEGLFEQITKETLPRKRAVADETQTTHIARERLPRKNVQERASTLTTVDAF